MTGECSRIMQNKVPSKLKDPGRFTIPCSMGKSYSGNALCDLGASINLMPKSIAKQLGIDIVKPTTVTLRLADMSIAYPEGIIEDVLIKIDKFVFLVDFVVLDFDADEEVPLILGRPFLATARTLIDVQKGELTMRVNDQEIKFNVMSAPKFSNAGVEECSFVMSLKPVVQQHVHKQGDHLVKTLTNTEKEKLVEEDMLQGEAEVNKNSKESEGGKDGSEEEESAKEKGSEMPTQQLPQQGDAETADVTTPAVVTPSEQLVPTEEVIAVRNSPRLKLKANKNPSPQSSSQPISTTSTKAIQRRKLAKRGQALSATSRLKVFPKKLKSRRSRPFKLVKVYPKKTVNLFEEATCPTAKVIDEKVKQYYGAHVVRDKFFTVLPKL